MGESYQFYTIDKRLLGFIVYKVIHENEILYIGSSARGLRRFDGHIVASQEMLRNNNISVEILYCESEEECRRIEKRLIDELKPVLNWRTRIHRDVEEYVSLKEARKYQKSHNPTHGYYLHIARTMEKV